MPGNGPETRPAGFAAIGVPEYWLVFAQPGELVMRRPAALVDVGVDEVDLRRHGFRLSRAISRRDTTGWPPETHLKGITASTGISRSGSSGRVLGRAGRRRTTPRRPSTG